MKHQMDEERLNSDLSDELEDLYEKQETEVIEDEPDKIDLNRFFHLFFKNWKALLVLLFFFGIGFALLRPGTSQTVIGSNATLYVPPTTYKMINGERRPIMNNVSQVENAIGLITSKVYRDEIAHELGTDSISDFGTYSVAKQKDTQLLTVNAISSNQEKAHQLCEAVVDVLQNSVGKTVSINEMLIVDPVSDYSNITVTSTLTSFIKGSLIGLGVYCIYAAYKYFSDRTFHSKQEAEEYLQVPVLCVLPRIDK